MMGNPKYAADWEAKKAWYVANGFRPYDEPDADGTRGVLIWTDDRVGSTSPRGRRWPRRSSGSQLRVVRPRRRLGRGRDSS